MIEDTAKTKNLKSSNPTIKIASDKEIQKISKKIIARNKDLYIALAKWQSLSSKAKKQQIFLFAAFSYV